MGSDPNENKSFGQRWAEDAVFELACEGVAALVRFVISLLSHHP